MLPISHPTRKPDAAERHTRDSLSQWRGAPQLARSRYEWLRTSCRELSGNYLHLDQANKKQPHCDVRKKDPVHKGCNRQRYAVAISVRVTCSTWCSHFYKSIRVYPHLSSYDKTTQTHTHTREPTVPTQEIVPAPNCHRVCSFPSVHRGRPGQFTIRLDGSCQICWFHTTKKGWKNIENQWKSKMKRKWHVWQWDTPPQFQFLMGTCWLSIGFWGNLFSIKPKSLNLNY